MDCRIKSGNDGFGCSYHSNASNAQTVPDSRGFEPGIRRISSRTEKQLGAFYATPFIDFGKSAPNPRQKQKACPENKQRTPNPFSGHPKISSAKKKTKRFTVTKFSKINSICHIVTIMPHQDRNPGKQAELPHTPRGHMHKI
ncbi:hypothetical protein [Telmatospirillum siberiense]|uniref:hypothetical protein n=1 Tax=Telmatospirillum siberiense TaxID=382514 RepID=UPI0011AED1BD|nr:hypothetical protein [Telmatospirillum siberiense]